MKEGLCAVIFVLMVPMSGAAQDCARHVEAEGGFSFCPPDGWTLGEQAGEKYQLAFGPRSDLFTPNISAKDDADSLPLPEYVTRSMRYALANVEQTGATSVTLVSQSDFIYASAQAGAKVMSRAEYKGLIITMFQYYFGGSGDKKVIMTCLGLESGQPALERVCDQSMKTFQFEK